MLHSPDIRDSNELETVGRGLDCESHSTARAEGLYHRVDCISLTTYRKY